MKKKTIYINNMAASGGLSFLASTATAGVWPFYI